MQCDLIAKEFSYHDYCYNILTKPVYEGKEYNDDNYDDSERDFSAVENSIFSKVLEDHHEETGKFIQREARK